MSYPESYRKLSAEVFSTPMSHGTSQGTYQNIGGETIRQETQELLLSHIEGIGRQRQIANPPQRIMAKDRDAWCCWLDTSMLRGKQVDVKEEKHIHIVYIFYYFGTFNGFFKFMNCWAIQIKSYLSFIPLIESFHYNVIYSFSY